MSDSNEYAAALWYAMGRLDQIDANHYGVMEIAVDFAGRYEDSIKYYGGSKSIYEQWETYAKELQSRVTVELGSE